jgi:hypothetical protein
LAAVASTVCRGYLVNSRFLEAGDHVASRLRRRIHISGRPLPALTLVAVLGAGLLCAAPPAQARFLRAPKWLKGPYRRYALTYDAVDSSQGHNVESVPNPPEGDSPCDFPVVTYDDASTAGYQVSYQVLFGRYRPPGKAERTAFVWRLKRHAPSGQWTTTTDSSPPAGCPDNPQQRKNRSCTTPLAELDSPLLYIRNGPRSHGAQGYVARLRPTLGWGTNGSCSNDNVLEQPVRTFPEVFPGWGKLIFTDRGVMARRTFKGKVASDPKDAHSGQGTDPQGDRRAQSVWTFSTGLNAKFTLAPVKR